MINQKMFSNLRKGLNKIYEKLKYTEFTESDLSKIGEELFYLLIENDVAYEVAENIVEKVKRLLLNQRVKRGEDKKKVFKTVLKQVLLSLFLDAPKVDIIQMIEERKGQNKPLIILFVGPNGHGKTTTIAKLAFKLKKQGYSSVIAASDTFRAGAIEQTVHHGKNVGIRVISHKYGADPAAVAYDAINYAVKHNIDVVLIDTAGRLQTNINLMNELKKIIRVTKPDLKVFVGDALTGNDALEMAKRFHEIVGIDASILTKVDADVKGGAAISIVYATKKPLIYIGTGQGYDDLVDFDPNWLVDKILGDS